MTVQTVQQFNHFDTSPTRNRTQIGQPTAEFSFPAFLCLAFSESQKYSTFDGLQYDLMTILDSGLRFGTLGLLATTEEIFAFLSRNFVTSSFRIFPERIIAKRYKLLVYTEKACLSCL